MNLFGKKKLSAAAAEVEHKTDYHTHTKYSPDAADTPRVMCQQALKQGLEAIAFTEHMEWDRGDYWFRDIDDYFLAVNSCKADFAPHGLTVMSGVELGNPHWHADRATQFVEAHRFDLTLASLHWLYDVNIHDYAVFKNREPNDVFADYFVEVGRMVKGFDFDVLAHFDRILWRATLQNVPFDPLAIEDTIRTTLQIIADDGRALELNSKCTVRNGTQWNEHLQTLLSWFYEQGGRNVVINSDAHRASQIQRNSDMAKEIFVAAGFEQPIRLDREPVVKW